MYNSYERGLADMQGKLFQMSGDAGYDSESFIKAFMKSRIAAKLDSEYDFLQWAGKEYIFEMIEDELGDVITRGGIVYDRETLYWTGYVYRLWHFYTKELSKTIYRTANAKRMNQVYYGYHTLDVEAAIDRLREAS